MIDSTRFSVERRDDGWAVRDNKQPPGSPFLDGLVFIVSDEKVAREHADHLNGVRRG